MFSIRLCKIWKSVGAKSLLYVHLNNVVYWIFLNINNILKIHEFYWILDVQVLNSQFMAAVHLWPLSLCAMFKYSYLLTYLGKTSLRMVCSHRRQEMLRDWTRSSAERNSRRRLARVCRAHGQRRWRQPQRVHRRSWRRRRASPCQQGTPTTFILWRICTLRDECPIGCCCL